MEHITDLKYPIHKKEDHPLLETRLLKTLGPFDGTGDPFMFQVVFKGSDCECEVKPASENVVHSEELFISVQGNFEIGLGRITIFTLVNPQHVVRGKVKPSVQRAVKREVMHYFVYGVIGEELTKLRSKICRLDDLSVDVLNALAKL